MPPKPQLRDVGPLYTPANSNFHDRVMAAGMPISINNLAALNLKWLNCCYFRFAF